MEKITEEKTREKVEIDATSLHYHTLNEIVKRKVAAGVKNIVLKNVNGQRYIATGISKPVKIEIFGTPGSDLAAFTSGPKVIVHGNAQDAVGNTMNEGEIIVHGNAGDVVGYAMRGGKIFIQGNVGYRVGIHMKSYKDKIPVIVIGGMAQDFLGEYMAGGILIMLALEAACKNLPAHYIGTGMHGGVMYLRGCVDSHQLGKEVSQVPFEKKDKEILEKYVKEFASHFNKNAAEILKGEFIKLIPVSKRPYGRLYAPEP